MRSNAVEDYLKAIYTLQETEGRAKTSRLAKKLGVTAGSVTDMLKRLSALTPRLLTYRHHQGARLTAAGRKAALAVIRRHRLLETFLYEVLDLPWNAVHREAEILEHHISDRVTDAIDQKLNFPSRDPHGEPIPDKNGKLPPIAQQCLSDLEEGASFRVARVQQPSDDLLDYLNTIGIGIDTTATVTGKASFEGLITLRVLAGGKNAAATLSRRVSDHLFVERLSP